MRRVVAALAVGGALIAATALAVPRDESPQRVRRVAHATPRAPAAMPDHAALVSLRRLATIGVAQARTLRAAVHRCAPRPARGPCVRIALGQAAASAKLNDLILRAIMARLRAGPCVRVAGRLKALMGTVAYLAIEGVRSPGAPGLTWADARAVARVGDRLRAVAHGPWPRHCAPTVLRA